MTYSDKEIESMRKKQLISEVKRDVNLFITVFRVILIIVFIILSISLITPFIYANGYIINLEIASTTNDINYEFNNDILFDSNKDNYSISDFNFRNESIYGQEYNATYSFYNEVGLSENNISFISYNSGTDTNCSNTIIQEKDNHKTVLQMFDNSSVGNSRIRNDFNFAISYGIIQFWLYFDGNGSQHFYFNLFGENNNRVFRTIFDYIDNEWALYDGSWDTIINSFITQNSWIHIGIDFNYSDNSIDCYINGILESSMNFENYERVDWIEFYTANGESNYYCYLDGIGYDFCKTYNATYSFTDDVIDIYNSTQETQCENNIDLIDMALIDSNCFVSIESEVDCHSKILNLSDYNSNGDVEIRDTFSNSQSIGKINFWLYGTDVSRAMYIYLGNNVKVRCASNAFDYYNGTDWISISDTSVSSNVWYNIEISFNCEFDTFNLSIDNGNKGNYIFAQDTDTLTTLFLISGYSNQNFEYYFDSIDYSWTSGYYDGRNQVPLEWYQENDNFKPIKELTGIYQVDKYEFCYLENGEFQNTNTEIPRWTEINGDGDNVQVVSGDDNYAAVVIKLDEADHIGFYKDFSIDNGIIDIYFRMEFIRIMTEYNNGQIEIPIYSSNGSLYIMLRFDEVSDNKMELDILDKNGWNNNVLNEYINEQQHFQVNIFIRNNITELNIYGEAVNDTQLFYECYELGKGLSKIEIKGLTGEIQEEPYSIECYTYNVGIYINGSSISNDYGEVKHYMGVDWNSQHHNLFTFKGYGNFSISANKFDTSFTKTITTKESFDNTSRFINIWDKFKEGVLPTFYDVNNSALVILSNESFTVDYWKIEGIDFTINNVPIDYSNKVEFIYSENVNINKSYFYATNGKLKYKLESNYSNKLEYIQLEYDIDNVECINHSLSVSHRKNNGYLYSEFRNYYTDDSFTTFSSSLKLKNENTILPQEKIISKFIFLATDNNESFIGSFNGYYSDITLIYYYNIGVIITTTSLLAIISIIIFIVVIPVLISKKTKLDFLFIPFVILMSGAGMITNLIPYWLGSIVIIFCIVYYLIKSKYG